MLVGSLLIFASLINPVFAVYREFEVNQQVTGPACGNGVCEADEDNQSCPDDCPLPPAGGISVDTVPPRISNISASEITTNSAMVSWETDEQAVCKLFLGKSAEYEIGSVAEEAFSVIHLIMLNNLTPNSVYHLKISCRDHSLNEATAPDHSFTTLIVADKVPPPNVMNFEAVAGDGQILLTWRNPQGDDFQGARILRNDRFYPTDPWDGGVVYEGAAESATDTDLENDVRYYYTIFSYDRARNFSSGVIASAVPHKIAAPEEAPIVPVPPGVIPPRPPVAPPPEEERPGIPIPEEVKEFHFEDFEFWQEGKKLDVSDGKLSAKPDIPLDVRVAYDKVPEVLKTIMMTLFRSRDDKSFSFLLRANKDKTAYVAQIVLEGPETYPFILQVLDYKHQWLKRFNGTIKIGGFGISLKWQKIISDHGLYIIYIILTLLIPLILFILWRRRKKEEEDKNPKY